MKSKKNNNIWKIIWIIGIYLALIIIFYLVVRYKVEWETKDFNRYLYFYNCSNQLCTSDIEQEKYYGKLLCKDDICPYIVERKNDYLIIKDDTNSYLYDYVNDKIINNKYNDYYFINNDLIAIENREGKYGIIDIQDNVISEPKYNKIIDYQNGYLIYQDNNKYGLKNVITSKEIITGYDEMSFVNEKYVVIKKNNKYMLYNYNEKKELTQKYNYLYSHDGYILTFNNKKIDILDKNQKSVLIIKINTYYEYITKQEQNSLNIRIEEGNLLFNVVNSENKYVTYCFDLSSGKLLN